MRVVIDVRAGMGGEVIRHPIYGLFESAALLCLVVRPEVAEHRLAAVTEMHTPEVIEPAVLQRIALKVEEQVGGIGRRQSWKATAFLDREAFHNRTFWVLNLAIMLLWTSQVSYSVHGQPFFESRGFSAGVAAALLGGSTLTAALVRAGSGFAYDRLSKPRLCGGVT